MTGPESGVEQMLVAMTEEEREAFFDSLCVLVQYESEVVN